MSQQNVLYTLRISILRIRLKVRFSCTVSCSLKVEGKEYEIPGEAELKNGEATMNWNWSQTLPLNLNKSSAYSIDKKCALLIYLKSSAGKIPAGTVTLNLARSVNPNSRELCSIDKCPDKNAIIEFDFSFERIEGRLEGSNQSLIQKVLYPIHSESFLKRSTSRDNLRSPRAQQVDNYNSSQIRYLRSSKAQGSIAGKQTVPLRRMPSKRGIETRFSLLEEYYSHEKQRDSSQQKIFGLEREVEGTRTKLSLIEQELTSKTNRVAELEKEAREASKKTETLQLEVRSGTSKIEILEKTNRDLINQIKQIKEKQEEDKLNFQNALKRVQIRQLSSKQQIKSLTEKLYASENEKQRMLFEKSLSYNQFEDREKKLRQTFKEKEKKMIEEKSTLVKKIDALQRQASKNSEQIIEVKAKNNEALQTTHELQLIVETLETENERYRNEVSDLRYELTKSRNQKKILEENLENNSKFNEQRRSYRKQINEKDMELTQLRDKLAQLENQSNRTKTTSEEAEKALKEKNSQLKLLERDYNILLKEHHFVTGQLSSKDLKLTSLLEELQSQMKRTKTLESKFADLENKLEQQREALQLQSAQNKNRCSALEEEIEKLNNDLFECHNAIESAQKENESLEQLIDQKNELIHNLQSNLIQLNDANQAYQLDKLELAEERKEVEEQLVRQIEEAQNQIKHLSSELRSLNQTHSAALSCAQKQLQKQRSIVNELNVIIREKQQQIARNNSRTLKMERQLESSQSMIDESNRQLKAKQGAIENLNSQIQNLRKRCEENQTTVNSLRNQNLQIDNEITDARLKLEELGQDLLLKQKELNSNSLAFQSYQTMAINALNIISSHIASPLSSEVAIDHCDSEFEQLGNEILRKIIFNSQKTASQLQQQQKSLAALQKQIMEMELERNDKQLHLLTTHKDLELLKKSTHEFSYELQNKASQVQMLRNESKKQQEEFVLQSQEYEAKISALSKSLSDKNKQIVELKQRATDSQRQLQQSQDTINDLENRLKKFEKEKKSFELENRQKVNQMDSNLREEIEKVNALETERANLERELKEEKTNVRKALRELQNKCFEQEQMENKFVECQQALILKQSECNKYKLIYNQLRQVHESFIATIGSPERAQLFSNRLQACSKAELKENIILFDKTRQAYHSIIGFVQQLKRKESTIFSLQSSLQSLSSQLSSARRDQDKLKVQNMKVSIDVKRQRDQEIATLSEEKAFFQAKVTTLDNQILGIQKERLTLRKQIEELKAKYEEQTKQAIKQKEFIFEVLKFAEEHKELIQIVRKLAGETTKTLNALQKEKKVSMFAVNPLREPLSKLEEILGGLYKSTIQMMGRHKREWDLAAFRKKKIQKKTSLEMKPI